MQYVCKWRKGVLRCDWLYTYITLDAELAQAKSVQFFTSKSACLRFGYSRKYFIPNEHDSSDILFRHNKALIPKALIKGKSGRNARRINAPLSVYECRAERKRRTDPLV